MSLQLEDKRLKHLHERACSQKLSIFSMQLAKAAFFELELHCRFTSKPPAARALMKIRNLQAELLLVIVARRCEAVCPSVVGIFGMVCAGGAITSGIRFKRFERRALHLIERGALCVV